MEISKTVPQHLTQEQDEQAPGPPPTNTTAPRRTRPPSPGKRLGVLPKNIVRLTAFGVISLTLFISAALCLLAVWDYAASDVAWRALVSFAIMMVTMIVFVLINEAFGRRAGDDG